MTEPLELLVEGWRALPHSYALVNHFQLAALARRPDVRLAVRDLPYFRAHWQPVGALTGTPDDGLVAALPGPSEEAAPDVTYRIGLPLRFDPAPHGRVFVFGTAELRTITAAGIADGETLLAAQARSDAHVVTPSRWSADGFVASGFPPARVHVVPHGVEPRLFHPPSAEERADARRSVDPNAFVFLHIGAMTGNKGLTALLTAFARLLPHAPHARLWLKGSDALFSSRALLDEAAAALPSETRRGLEGRIDYVGGALTSRDLARLYFAADAYVSPYRAEAFNLPVLEAMACARPVICTGGGPTDDFADHATAFVLPSRHRVVRDHDQLGRELTPDDDALLAALRAVVDQPAAARARAEAAALRVASAFTWDRVVERLCAVLRGAA